MIRRIASLTKKTAMVICHEGIKGFGKKADDFLKKRKEKKNTPKTVFNQSYVDVLFINGCTLPHPSRYRVSHQMEQLFAYNITSKEVFYEDLTLDLVKCFRLFIFFRCPYTDTVGDFIKLAKEHNKTVLFDIDDLVIDQKYTDQIKYVQKMNTQERTLYDDGVNRMRKTLLLCDGAITTTERLAEELKNFVPDVFINRNVASDRMVELSEKAVFNRDVFPFQPTDANLKKQQIQEKNEVLERIHSGMIRIGYFSGSITHNSDIEMILPALKAIMQKHKNVELYFCGEMDVPEELKQFADRIIAKPFVPWEELPKLIASVDINIAPLENNIFNEAKSENKWVEAALVKVPTVASKIGAFEKMIEDGETGILCETLEDWEKNLDKLIQEKNYRDTIAANAFEFVKHNAISIETGYALSQYIISKMTTNLLMILPSTKISGGVLVALKHCEMLRNAGLDVTILNEGPEYDDITYNGYTYFVLSYQYAKFFAKIDKAVSTFWATLLFQYAYPNIRDRYYFVQGYEVNFTPPGNAFRFEASQTYVPSIPVQFITISKWCKEWLEKKYGQKARYARNGIVLDRFPVRNRSLAEKVRILIEGSSEDFYKNVDESFRIVEGLSKEKYEIWYMSYNGEPKSWYRIDKFLYKIPNEEVGKIYNQCDILLKSSLLESFSYPPLEMMATGGYCVVAPNEGNAEILVDEYNCLLYEQGNTESAVRAIERISQDTELQKTLYENGLETAKSRDWDQLTEEVLALYDVQMNN